MPYEQTQRVMSGYFTALGTGQFSQFFTEGVTWTTVEVDDVVRGSTEVQNHILKLHGGMSDAQTRQLVIADGNAYIEGSCASIQVPGSRTLYCVAYDLD